MKLKISKRISSLQQFSLSELGIDQLLSIKSQINDRISDLENDLTQIEDKLGTSDLDRRKREFILPEKFTSPLRTILARGWDINRIENLYNRYIEEKEKINNIVYEKKLEAKQSKILKGKFKQKQYFIVFLIVFVLSLMGYEFAFDLSKNTIKNIFYIDTLCCLIFLSNFFFELYLSENKKWYWKTHWIDFITSIPLPSSLSVVRAGRGIRLIRLARLFRILRILRFLKVVQIFTQYWRGMEPLTDLMDIKLMKRTLLWSVLITIFCSLLIYQAESEYANFENWYSGLWWGITTILTGGFTDLHNPSTFIGYFATIILVLSGMILIGVFVASLSSVIEANHDDVVGSVKYFIDKRFNAIEKDIERLSKKLKDS